MKNREKICQNPVVDDGWKKVEILRKDKKVDNIIKNVPYVFSFVFLLFWDHLNIIRMKDFYSLFKWWKF